MNFIAGLIIGFLIGFYLAKSKRRESYAENVKQTPSTSMSRSHDATPTLREATEVPVTGEQPKTPVAERSFDAKEAKEEARQFIALHKIDRNLLKVYEEVNHYGTWSKRADFDKWNIGVSDVTSEKRKTKIAYYDIELEFLSFGYCGKKITLAFGDYHGYTPDGGWTETDVIYYVEDTLIATLRYDCQHHDYGSSLTFSGVEELHKDEQAFQLLEQLSNLIDQRKLETKQRRKEEENQQYQGKFT